MGIVSDDIERVRAASDLVSIASEHLALRRVGLRQVGLCPFHAERTPSFSINAEAGLYYCFGCGAKGDVITFVREVHHLDFAAAVEWLAGRAGIQVRYDSSRESTDRRRRSRLVEALTQAVEWYHQRLLTGPDASRARGYLRSRGYDGEVVRRYRLGWAPDEWDALCRDLALPEDVLRDTGLGFRNRRNRMQDAFRARVLFPIYDARGDPVAFGGRVLPGAEGPKYKNSPQTTVYDKSQVLYGLNWAKGPAVEAGEIIVCEGYTDVIGLATAGLPRAVAPCGTALTERHVATLKGFARRIVLAFDADAAGQGAAERFYEWERRYDVDVHVAAIPPGSDPGELAQHQPAALRTAVAEAVPFLAFRLRRALAAADLTTAEGRARAAESAVGMIAEHPSELVRDQYLMEVADRCRVDPDRLRALLRRGGHPAPPARVSSPARVTRDTPEAMTLRMVVHHPEAVADLLHEALFTDDVHAAAFRALASSADLRAAIDEAEPTAAELLQRLAVEEPSDADPLEVVSRLADEAATQVLAALEVEARHADDPIGYAGTTGWLKLQIEEMRNPARDRAAIGQLVAWLAQRAAEERE